MNLNNVNLEMTAGLASQMPGRIKTGLPQIALCGRSNVGKSSLINTLLGRKSLARVSSEPGKTITVNFYNADGKLYLVDLPGYGYAKRSFEERNKWKGLIDKYFSLDCDVLYLQLIDVKAGITKDDEGMLNYLKECNLPFAVVCTKCDKPNKTERAAYLEKIAASPALPYDAAVIPFSSKTGEGKSELWEIIGEFCDFVKNGGTV